MAGYHVQSDPLLVQVTSQFRPKSSPAQRSPVFARINHSYLVSVIIMHNIDFMSTRSTFSNGFEQEPKSVDTTEKMDHSELQFYTTSTPASSCITTQQKGNDGCGKPVDTLARVLQGSLSISRGNYNAEGSESSISMNAFVTENKASHEQKQELQISQASNSLDSSVPEICFPRRYVEDSESSLKNRMMPSEEPLRWNGATMEETSSRSRNEDEGTCSTTLSRSRRRLRALLSSSDSSIDSSSEMGHMSQDSTTSSHQSLCSDSSRRRERKQGNVYDMLLLSKKLEKQERRLRQKQKRALRDLEKIRRNGDDDKEEV